MKAILVPGMLVIAGSLMAFAWIGHLKFKSMTFWSALCMSWLMVLPEYVLNVYSARWGRDIFTGAQMAAIHLVAGVFFVALISRFFLKEPMGHSQVAGFALMAVAIVLVLRS